MNAITVPLSSRKYPGLVAVVDEIDAPLVVGRTWMVHKSSGTFYAFTYVRNDRPDGSRHYDRVWMHGLISGIAKGKGDHRDGDGLNNRRSNLRPATHLQNCRNRGTEKKKGRTSAYKGVSWNRQQKKWVAKIKYNDHIIHFGYYESETHAAVIYNAAAHLLFGEYARLNDVPLLPLAESYVILTMAKRGVRI